MDGGTEPRRMVQNFHHRTKCHPPSYDMNQSVSTILRWIAIPELWNAVCGEHLDGHQAHTATSKIVPMIHTTWCTNPCGVVRVDSIPFGIILPNTKALWCNWKRPCLESQRFVRPWVDFQPSLRGIQTIAQQITVVGLVGDNIVCIIPDRPLKSHESTLFIQILNPSTYVCVWAPKTGGEITIHRSVAKVSPKNAVELMFLTVRIQIPMPKDKCHCLHWEILQLILFYLLH